MREGFQNWLIVCSIIFMLGIITYFMLPQREIEDSEEVLGIESVEYKYVPYIVSVAPQYIRVGESFEYIVEASDLDTPYWNLTYSLSEKPIWMDIQGNTVSGIPLQPGTYKYVVTVSDGVNSSSQINYVLVEGNE